MSRLRTLKVPFGLLVLASCAREPKATTEDARRDAKPAAPSPAKPRADTSPAALVSALGPTYPEHGHDQPVPPLSPNAKSVGKLGERLEADVYFLKLVALHPCKGAAASTGSGQTARIAVGAEVEITAKTRMNASPRYAELTTGGITFEGGVDLKRELEGCTPLLKISTLNKDDVTKGFVVFDIPVTGPGSDLKTLGLRYHPARFGGSGPVFVRAEGG